MSIQDDFLSVPVPVHTVDPPNDYTAFQPGFGLDRVVPLSSVDPQPVKLDSLTADPTSFQLGQGLHRFATVL
jgi:hypothetical protein